MRASAPLPSSCLVLVLTRLPGKATLLQLDKLTSAHTPSPVSLPSCLSTRLPPHRLVSSRRWSPVTRRTSDTLPPVYTTTQRELPDTLLHVHAAISVG